MEKIGAKIGELAKSTRTKLTTLAVEADVDLHRLYLIVEGRVKVTVIELYRIAKYFGTTMDRLVEQALQEDAA